MASINVSAFQRLKQDEIKTFSDRVYGTTFGKSEYAPFQAALTAMNDAAIAFQEALVKATSRDAEKVRLKDVAKTLLFQKITALAKLMDIQWPDGNLDYLKEEAGFTLNKAPHRKVVTFVEAPTELTGFNLKQRGIVKVQWKRADNAVTTAFETQQPDGTWKNGMYSEKETMELNYPFGTRLVLRAKTIGPNLVTSDFTEPIEVMVS